MNNQHLLSTIVMGISAVILTGCGGGGGSGSSPSSDSGSKFDSTLSVTLNGSTTKIASQTGSNNPTAPSQFVYTHSQSIYQPHITVFSFKLNPLNDETDLDLAYNNISQKIVSINYTPNTKPTNPIYYSCYDSACSNVSISNINQITGTATIKFNQTKVSDVTLNGILSGSLYSSPLLFKNIPQRSSGSISVNGESFNIFTAFFAENKSETPARNFLYASDDKGNTLDLNISADGSVKFLNLYQESSFTSLTPTSLDGLTFKKSNDIGIFTLNNISTEDSQGNIYNINGKIQAPETISTLTVNGVTWDASSIVSEDTTLNNYLVRSFILPDTNNNYQELIVLIKNKNIIGLNYTNNKENLDISCGIGAPTVCTNISLSNDYNTITFKQAKLGNIILNGVIDYNVR